MSLSMAEDALPGINTNTPNGKDVRNVAPNAFQTTEGGHQAEMAGSSVNLKV